MQDDTLDCLFFKSETWCIFGIYVTSAPAGRDRYREQDGAAQGYHRGTDGVPEPVRQVNGNRNHTGQVCQLQTDRHHTKKVHQVHHRGQVCQVYRD